MTELNFNAEEVAPAGSFEPVPPGDYLMQIVESEMRETRAGNGRYLRLVLEGLEGAAKGRKFFDNLNLENPNPQTVQIAERRLSSICYAVGVLEPTASEQLHFRPMRVSVRVRLAGPDKQGIERDATNEIRKYAPAKDVLRNFPPERATASQAAWAG